MNESRINKLRDIRDLVSDEFKKYYNKSSDIVLNYFDSLLKGDEAINMNKRREIKSKLKSNVLLLGVWKFLLEGDIL